MGKGAVGLSHFMNVVALANGRTLIVGGFLDFVGESLVHRHTLAVAGVVHNPAHSQGFGTGRIHFKRHLVSSATDAAALHFHTGFGIFNAVRREPKTPPNKFFADYALFEFTLGSGTQVSFAESEHRMRHNNKK